MPSINVVDMKGSNAKTIELNDSIFAIEPNEAVMHQMVVLKISTVDTRWYRICSKAKRLQLQCK